MVTSSFWQSGRWQSSRPACLHRDNPLTLKQPSSLPTCPLMAPPMPYQPKARQCVCATPAHYPLWWPSACADACIHACMFPSMATKYDVTQNKSVCMPLESHLALWRTLVCPLLCHSPMCHNSLACVRMYVSRQPTEQVLQAGLR